MIFSQTAAMPHPSTHPSRRRSRGGFTLIELLVVMAVILILMSMIVGVSVLANNQATTGRAKAELQEIQNALQAYRIENGNYPLSGEFRQAVFPRLPKDVQTRLEKRSQSVLLDPWKREYLYRYDDAQPETYDLYSKGRKETIDADDIRPGQ